MKNYYDGIVANSSEELVKAIPLLEKGEIIYLVEKYSDEGELLNPISRSECMKIRNILNELKSIARAKDYLLFEGGWLINNDKFLMIKKCSQKSSKVNKK